MNYYGNANYSVRSRNTLSETIKLVATCRFKTCQYAISSKYQHWQYCCLTMNRKYNKLKEWLNRWLKIIEIFNYKVLLTI